MRYAFKDLGEQPAGAEVTVRLEGTAANVLLLDAHNYSCYRAARPFRYAGGMFRTSPARVTIPRDGHWHLVVDLGGFRGRVRARIAEITPPPGQSTQEGEATREAGAELGETLEAVQ